MRGVAGDEHPALAVVVGEQQVLLPFADIERVELQRHADGLREHPHHVLVAVDDGMQREVLGGILHDHLRRAVVGDVIVPALADRDAVEQLLAIVQRLAKLQHAVFVAGKLDAEPLAHHARPAVAADEIGRGDLRDLAVQILHGRRHAVGILAERQQLMAVAHRDARQRLRHRFQERLERVLRNQLVAFERQRAVVGRRDLGLERLDRRVLLVEQRRVDQVGEHDEHVHRHVGRQSGGADAVGQPHAPIDFHGTRIGALHLRQEQRRFLLLEQHAAARRACRDRRRASGRSDRRRQ